MCFISVINDRTSGYDSFRYTQFEQCIYDLQMEITNQIMKDNFKKIDLFRSPIERRIVLFSFFKLFINCLLSYSLLPVIHYLPI